MTKTPGKIHMYDMVKIDTIVFETVGGGAFKAKSWLIIIDKSNNFPCLFSISIFTQKEYKKLLEKINICKAAGPDLFTEKQAAATPL